MPCRKCKHETPPDALYCPFCGVSLEPKKHTHKPRTRPNGAGTAFKRGNMWYSQVTIGEKPVIRNGKPAYQSIRVTKGGFTRKSDALAYCPTLKAEALTSRKAEKEKLTTKQIYDLWLPTHENKVSHSTRGSILRPSMTSSSPISTWTICRSAWTIAARASERRRI